MDIKQKQKKQAIDIAKKMGLSPTEEKVRDVSSSLEKMKRGPVASIWDKVMMLWDAFRSPSTPKTLKCSLIGCLIYLVTPLDLIPDVLFGVGLLDDVAVVLWGCSLLDKLRQTKAGKAVEGALSSAAGAVVGAAAGAVVGAKAGSVVAENGGVENALKEGKEKLFSAVKPLVVSLVRGQLKSRLHRSIERSSLSFIMFLFSLFLLVTPLFGSAPSAFLSALLLLASLLLCLLRGIRSIRKAWPFLLLVVREKSVDAALETFARSLLTRAVEAHAPALPSSLVERIPVDSLIADVKKWCLADILKSVAALALVFLSFFLLRFALREMSVSLSSWQIIVYPFAHAIRTLFS